MTEKIILDVLVVIWLVSWLVFIANKDVILFCSYQLIKNNYDPIIVLARKYNINSSSDMRRFKNDLEKDIMKKANAQISASTYEIICDKCKNKIHAKAGHNICPHCGEEIDLKINWN